jgi:flagellar motility protein MotE (MotC chaperone)
MKTRKPLASLIPAILKQFDIYRGQLQFDLDLYKMHEGQVKTFVEKSLREEMISNAAYSRAIKRIPSINIPKKVTDKLSKVYAEAPIRYTSNDTDRELIEEFSRLLNVNSVLNYANKMSNLNYRCALEIFVEEGKQHVRVLNAHQFFVYSDSPTSPNKPTVFCKLLGREEKMVQQVSTTKGKRITNADEIQTVDILALYSDTEFMIIDTSGELRQDKMSAMGLSGTNNPFGLIPFVYINKSQTELIPYTNQTSYDMGILIPKLLTDLNYSAQYLSHSVVWTKNTDLSGAEINPDAVVNLGDSREGEGEPEIGTINPVVDIDGILSLIQFQLSSYLSTEGLKAGSVGQMEASSASSGISKIIDESDATEARKDQTELFHSVEKDFWYKFSVMQKVWSTSGLVEEKQTLDPEFLKTFVVKFAEIKPLESEKTKYEKIQIARDLKLITKKQALKDIYPNMPDDQLNARIEELEEELTKEKDEMMSMGLTPGATQLSRQQLGVSDEAIVEQAVNGSEPE